MLKVEIASVPDRDFLVAEIWQGENMIAEVWQKDQAITETEMDSKDDFFVEVYMDSRSKSLVFSLDAFLDALSESKNRLSNR